ncbi:MAG: M48 family metallopeptidase [Alicyclobacillus macrosporangiidus]|uniref:M48 family metallopeptidase n=1 Tax=Alicyclobacillus macrosporangiidus TaxID=392015 RepID=UPI0026F1D390|nr:SprT family zinc-dependent metalloprotease [Alicyclobacillus macrosporangiidus]MCL6598104.1 M48 family metallopeptidase [Alicyclobacillus macrosporangiidus]
MAIPLDPDLPVHVIRSRRRRRTIALEVTPEGLWIRAPISLTDADIARIVERRRAWIRRTYEARVAAQAREGGRVWQFLGRPVEIRYIPCPDQTSSPWRMWWEAGAVHVSGPGSALPDDVLKRLFTEWYQERARVLLSDRAARWAEKLGLRYRSLRIKDQKSRWGSCSSAGNINLNWRLVQAPEWVTDYVIVHELCHLVELNHSPRFWALVHAAIPDAERAKRWLRDHGQELFF